MKKEFTKINRNFIMRKGVKNVVGNSRIDV